MSYESIATTVLGGLLGAMVIGGVVLFTWLVYSAICLWTRVERLADRVERLRGGGARD